SSEHRTQVSITITRGRRTRHLPRRLAALAAVAVTFAAVSGGRADTVTDATGRVVTATDASRIVSIGGAVTEILYALHMDAHIVAVDTTSLFPPRALKDKPNVGYMRQLSAEGVLGTAPSLILAIESAGPKETMAVLQSAKVPLVVVPDVFSGDGIVEKVKVVAAAAGVAQRAGCVIAGIRADLDALDRIKVGIEAP